MGSLGVVGLSVMLGSISPQAYNIFPETPPAVSVSPIERVSGLYPNFFTPRPQGPIRAELLRLDESPKGVMRGRHKPLSTYLGPQLRATGTTLKARLAQVKAYQKAHRDRFYFASRYNSSTVSAIPMRAPSTEYTGKHLGDMTTTVACTTAETRGHLWFNEELVTMMDDSERFEVALHEHRHDTLQAAKVPWFRRSRNAHEFCTKGFYLILDVIKEEAPPKPQTTKDWVALTLDSVATAHARPHYMYMLNPSELEVRLMALRQNYECMTGRSVETPQEAIRALLFHNYRPAQAEVDAVCAKNKTPSVDVSIGSPFSVVNPWPSGIDLYDLKKLLDQTKTPKAREIILEQMIMKMPGVTMNETKAPFDIC